MNELFRVDSLDEITYDHFEAVQTIFSTKEKTNLR